MKETQKYLPSWNKIKWSKPIFRVSNWIKRKYFFVFFRFCLESILGINKIIEFGHEQLILYSWIRLSLYFKVKNNFWLNLETTMSFMRRKWKWINVYILISQ